MGEKKEENFSVSYPLKFLLNSIDWRCPEFFFGTITSKFALAALIVMEILLSTSLVMVYVSRGHCEPICIAVSSRFAFPIYFDP